MSKKIGLLYFLALILIVSVVSAASDQDGDGFLVPGRYDYNIYENKVDCDDKNPNIHPDIKYEVFNGRDDDCDGEVDEGLYWKQIRGTFDYVCFANGCPDCFANGCKEMSFCSINKSLDVLECKASESRWIEVYQNVSHLGRGDYRFAYDLVSGSEPAVSVRVDNSEECTSNGCTFNVANSDQTVDVIFRFTTDAMIDNVSLILVDDGHNLTGIRPTLQNEPFMTQPKPASCCPDDYCWDGERCVDSDDYMQNTTMPPIVMNSNNDGYRCIKDRIGDVIQNTSDWVFSEEKADPFNDQKGYCPYPDMCLVTTNVSSDFGGDYNHGPPYYGCAKPGDFTTNEHWMSKFLYDDEGYFKDFYCDNGNWTSRTKFVAMTLLDIARESGEDFILFCDKAKDIHGSDPFSSLNYYMEQDTDRAYVFDPGLFESNVDDHLFNNFCALVMNTAKSSDDDMTGEIFDSNDQVLIGAALDADLDQPVPGNYNDQTPEYLQTGNENTPQVKVIMESLFGDTCEGDPQSSGYRECTENLYYNDQLWSFIYSTKSIDKYSGELGADEGFLRKLIGFIPDMFDNIMGFFRSSLSTNLYNIDQSYLNNDDTFQKIYISKIGSIQVEAINQRKMVENQEGFNMADYAYFKYIGYPICRQNDQNLYELDVSYSSDKGMLDKILHSEFTVNCDVAQDDGESVHSFVIEGTTPSSDRKIDEVWYDLTAKLRPLR